MESSSRRVCFNTDIVPGLWLLEYGQGRCVLPLTAEVLGSLSNYDKTHKATPKPMKTCSMRF